MTDHNTSSIGDLIKGFLSRNKLGAKFEEVDLQSNWEEVAGHLIASHTREIRLRDHTLTLKLNSAALRHTLSFSKTEFMEKINARLGKDLIREVILK